MENYKSKAQREQRRNSVELVSLVQPSLMDTVGDHINGDHLQGGEAVEEIGMEVSEERVDAMMSGA